MSKCFIEGMGGGGSTKLFAAIGVTYPEGSTVTCTNGAKTLTAKTTTGQWLFAIPEAGTWTVTATDGTNSKSQSVSITTEGQLESVELSYEHILFKAGSGIGNGVSLCLAKLDGSVDQRKTITNSDLPYTGDGVYATTDSFGNSNSGVGLSAYGENPIDVSNYDTLYVDMKCTSRYASTYSVTIGVGNDTVKGQDQPGNWAASKAGIYNGSRATHSVDLSEVTGEKYIKIYGYAVVYEVYNWWLE